MEAMNFQVSYALTNVDTINRTAKLRVQKDNGPVFLLNVVITRLIAHLINKQRQGQTKTNYEGTTFVSQRFDPIYNHNPFALVKFMESNGEFRNYCIQHVKEAGRYRQAMRDSFGRRIYVEGYRYKNSTEFNRYIERKLKQ